ncbi:MAG: hypothetical protein R3F39_22980 [Myxococcota bacterium]
MNTRRTVVGRISGVAVALGLTLFGGCDGGDSHTLCPGGEEAAIQGSALCVYRGPISETGFSCPPEMPFAYESSGYSACAAQPGMTIAVAELLAAMPALNTGEVDPFALDEAGCVGSACLGNVGTASAGAGEGAATSGGAFSDASEPETPTTAPSEAAPEANPSRSSGASSKHDDDDDDEKSGSWSKDDDDEKSGSWSKGDDDDDDDEKSGWWSKNDDDEESGWWSEDDDDDEKSGWWSKDGGQAEGGAPASDHEASASRDCDEGRERTPWAFKKY